MVLDEQALQGIRDAAEIIKKSNYVTCLTGAGISVESGIRPFRGPGGSGLRRVSRLWMVIEGFSLILRHTGRED